jgi:hypothetical protein
MRRVLPVILLGLAAIGAGPCDLLGDMMGDSDAGAAGCAEGLCVDQLNLELIRADNDPFLAGAYRFALALPDGSEYSVDCYMAHQESGMECDIGDLDVMFPLVDLGAARIWLIVIGAPASLVVTVEYNALVIGEREIVPAYEQVYPEGEQCPSCFLAEESMAVMPW